MRTPAPVVRSENLSPVSGLISFWKEGRLTGEIKMMEGGLPDFFRLTDVTAGFVFVASSGLSSSLTIFSLLREAENWQCRLLCFSNLSLLYGDGKCFFSRRSCSVSEGSESRGRLLIWRWFRR